VEGGAGSGLAGAANVNLHVYPAGRPELERYLAFRDRLRDHPGDRDHYQRVKRELAQRDWACVQQYADAKTAVVEEIIARARADAGGAAPGPAPPALGRRGNSSSPPRRLHDSFTGGRQHRG
jgi:hypothetical protein